MVADDERRSRYQDRIRWLRAEQALDTLPAGLDPELLYLSLMGATMYPLLLPHVCVLVTGEDPTTDAFADRYRAHLIALTAALAAAEGPSTGTPARTGRRRGAG